MRLRIPGGDLTSEQLMEIGKIAKDWGKGEIHLTTRQGIEVPWITFGDLKEVTRILDQVGTPPGSCGPRVRNISSCVGLPRCPRALVDSRALAKKLDEMFFNVVLPTKLKIAVSACPNSCAKPQVNDLGVVAAAQPRIDPDSCDACGKCVRACKEGAIKVVDEMPRIDYASCINCGARARGHATLIRIENRWYITWDFIYNKELSKSHLLVAKEFIDVAEFALSNNKAAFIENLFSASELIVKSVLLGLPDPKFRVKTTHKGIHRRYNRWAYLGNVKVEHRNVFNKIASLRPKARYLQDEFSLTDSEARSILCTVKSMFADANSMIKRE